MSLSYSGITNNGKITLPSVDTWGTNMNILRDPPKSITTRRINKVGETSSITQMIDDSSNRACESISHYARGVNPFVSVSYNNNGKNGGQNLFSQNNNGKQAFLPYTIIKDGAFRPPVVTQQQLLPLSRLPRVWTTAFSQPGFVDFSKKIRTCGTAKETKEVYNNVLRAYARPTSIINISKPLEKPYEVKYVIQNPNKISATSGIRTLDITEQNVQKPSHGIELNSIHAFAQSNLNQNK